MKKIILISFLQFVCNFSLAKEIALTFDDAPVVSSKHFESSARTDEMIKKLKILNVPEVMIFANPCKDLTNSIVQLKKYIHNSIGG